MRRKQEGNPQAAWRRVSARIAAILACAMALGAAGPGWALSGDEETQYRKMPGYVDFAGMGVFGEEDATVEVFLHDALLGMVAAMTRSADPELSTMLAGLKLVRVQRFDIGDVSRENLEKKTDEMARKLEKQAWFRAVRVREDDENVYVYFKLADDKLQGITVMAIEDDDEATFVNIVGEIDPEQLGRLGRKFDIDVFEGDYDWSRDFEKNKDKSSRSERDRDREKKR